MKSYNIFAVKLGGDEKIQLNDSPVPERQLERAERFYLARGEWLDRGYCVKEEEIK